MHEMITVQNIVQIAVRQKKNRKRKRKKLGFKHTCSQCGRTFEVKFNMQKGQTTIPKLSATCPECNSKENVTF